MKIAGCARAYCNDAIQISNEIKYFGVLLDVKLNFLLQILTLETTLSRNVGVLIKLQKFLSTSALFALYFYFALIHSFLSYGVLVWGPCNKSYTDKIGKTGVSWNSGLVETKTWPFLHSPKIILSIYCYLVLVMLLPSCLFDFKQFEAEVVKRRYFF